MQTIVFCGAGFLGSWIIRFYIQRAVTMGVHNRCLIIDGDKFEDRNLPTQNCYPKHLGVFKADVAAAFVDYFNVEVVSLNTRLTIADLDIVIKDYEPALVVDTFDNIQSRLITKFLADKAGCECLHLGISEHGFGRVEWSGKWSSDPTRCLEIPEDSQVEVPPCELVFFQQLGIRVAIRGAVEMLQHITGGVTQSWFVTDKEDSIL